MRGIDGGDAVPEVLDACGRIIVADDEPASVVGAAAALGSVDRSCDIADAAVEQGDERQAAGLGEEEVGIRPERLGREVAAEPLGHTGSTRGDGSTLGDERLAGGIPESVKRRAERRRIVHRQADDRGFFAHINPWLWTRSVASSTVMS